MPLIKCPDCGRDISDKAAACIHCGCPITPKSAVTRVKMPTFKLALPALMRNSEYGLLDMNTGAVLWRGKVGAIATMTLDRPVMVKIQYYWACVPNSADLGQIEPGKNYRISGGTKLVEVTEIV